MPDKIKLLIVDDEVKFLESIARRLELRDFDVTKATNGQDALTIAGKDRFDLVLLDLKMPGLNGKQVLEILKKDHKFLEVIILTGHGSLDSAVECTRLGAFDYLPKPYELESLLEKLQKAYEARLQKKFESDQERLEKIANLATGHSALGILRELRKLDDEEK
ncbi:MAG: response regulator [candidate division Zixibacteria bacterium]|jgi:two-component system NtrC family response regulator|nr:response regulator [candidate division Zixibacteria bacterium]